MPIDATRLDYAQIGSGGHQQMPDILLSMSVELMNAGVWTAFRCVDKYRATLMAWVRGEARILQLSGQGWLREQNLHSKHKHDYEDSLCGKYNLTITD